MAGRPVLTCSIGPAVVWSDADASLSLGRPVPPLTPGLMSLDSTLAYRGAGVSEGPLKVARRLVVRPVVVVVVAALAAIVPAWNPVWYQDDQLPTLFRTLHTALAHQWGVLYPRLAPELGFGYGRLLHQFYPPLGVELAAWLHAVGLGYIDAARMTFSLCLLLSALGMYAYARTILAGPWAAALAAIAYVWSPYVLLDAHKGGVLGESVALAIMPWALLALHRLVTRGGLTWLAATALGLALVVLGHNITALFFVGLASIYGLILVVGQLASRTHDPPALTERAAAGRLVLLVIGVLLALALAAIYWLPALTELPYSRVSEQRSGDFNVVRNLTDAGGLFQPSVPFDYYAETVPRFGLVAGLLTLTAIVLLAVAVIARRRHRRAGAASERSPDVFALIAFALCFVVVLLLQLRATASIWQTVPLISFVQFPQRLFVFGAFAGALVIGAVPWSARALGASERVSAWVGVGIAAGLAATSLPGLFWTWPVAASHLITEDQVGIATAAERRLAERRAFDDYFPIWVEEDSAQIIRPASPSRAELYEAANDGPVPHLRIVERDYLRLRAETDAAEPSTLVLHSFYFPGWQAEADGQPLEVGPAGPLGLVRVQVPPGQHLVSVWFGETPVRMAAAVISSIALVVVLALLPRGVGPRRTVAGLVIVLVVASGPWIARRALDPIDRPPAWAIDADVSPTARLVAVEPGGEALQRGETITLTLLWQATGYSARDVQSGLRLVPIDSDQIVAERWARPDRDRSPTGKWIVGELVPDTIQLRIPPTARPGRYRLLAGLRDGDAPARTTSPLVPIAEIDVR